MDMHLRPTPKQAALIGAAAEKSHIKPTAFALAAAATEAEAVLTQKDPALLAEIQRAHGGKP